MSRIAVCTPTRNRRWAWEWARAAFDAQDIPAERLIWIIVDNSDDPEKDWSPSKEHPRVQYTHVEGRKTIGEMRNLCLEEVRKTDAEFMAFWDDDDYYVPHRLSSGLKALEARPDAQYAGCTLLYLLLVRENLLLKVGPYGENHSTAASWIVRRSYVDTHKFDPTATRGEEASFMCMWRTPMATVEPENTLLVMGHSANTVDKSQVHTKAAQFLSTSVNSHNGKMVARMQWFRTPEVWDRFRSTFSAASSAPPRATT